MGIYGCSYHAIATLNAVAAGPPHLRAALAMHHDRAHPSRLEVASPRAAPSAGCAAPHGTNARAAQVTLTLRIDGGGCQ